MANGHRDGTVIASLPLLLRLRVWVGGHKGNVETICIADQPLTAVDAVDDGDLSGALPSLGYVGVLIQMYLVS